MNIKFSKDKLDLLLKKFDKKIADFIKSTYSSKEQKNKAVQIHKLLNPKINAPKYYTENNLSGDLANWFNKMKDDKDNVYEIKIEDISTEDGNLEDVFVQLTKH